jgi:hypothetical protein
MSSLLSFAGPVAVLSLAGLFVPMIGKGSRAAQGAREKEAVGFLAIRLSGQEHSWTADAADGALRGLKRTKDYPFAQPYAYRFTCWRALLLNVATDPVIDITAVNRGQEAILVTSIGIEIVAVAAMQERREPVDVQPPLSIPGATRVVPVPDTLALLPQQEAHAEDEFHLELAKTVIEADASNSITLSEPFYLRAGKAWRFEMLLYGLCARTPPHALLRVTLGTETAILRSAPIYLRR